jgi:hypothetical protein
LGSILGDSTGHGKRKRPAGSEWIAAIKKAEKMDVSYYVAAHGFVDDARTMKALRQTGF